MPAGFRLNQVPLRVTVAHMPLALDAALEHLVGQMDDDLLVRPHRGGWLLSPGGHTRWVMSLMPDGDLGAIASLSSLPDAPVAIASSRPADWAVPGGDLRLQLEHTDASSTAFSVHTYAGVSVTDLSQRLGRRLGDSKWRRVGHGAVHEWVRTQEHLYAVVVEQQSGSALVAWHSRRHARSFREASAP